MLHHLVAALFNSYSAPHAIFFKFQKNLFRFGQVTYNTIHPFGENNEPGFQSRQVPFWKGFISIVLSVIL